MRRKQPNFPGTAFEDESEPVCVAVVTTRAEAELIVGSRSCNSTVFRC
jgi:hypothetical protein